MNYDKRFGRSGYGRRYLVTSFYDVIDNWCDVIDIDVTKSELVLRWERCFLILNCTVAFPLNILFA